MESWSQALDMENHSERSTIRTYHLKCYNQLRDLSSKTHMNLDRSKKLSWRELLSSSENWFLKHFKSTQEWARTSLGFSQHAEVSTMTSFSRAIAHTTSLFIKSSTPMKLWNVIYQLLPFRNNHLLRQWLIFQGCQKERRIRELCSASSKKTVKTMSVLQLQVLCQREKQDHIRLIQVNHLSLQDFNNNKKSITIREYRTVNDFEMRRPITRTICSNTERQRSIIAGRV